MRAHAVVHACACCRMLTCACAFVMSSVWGDVQNLARIGDQVLSVDGVNLEGTQFLTYADVC
jgi:hypothetical protein